MFLIAPLLRGRVHYAWFVAGATFLLLLAAAGIRSVPGVLILPLEEEFGWDRATISLAISLNILLFGLWGPFAAAMMDRFGMRRVLLTALSVLACSWGSAAARWRAGSVR